MPLPDLIQRARQGDTQAISRLITDALAAEEAIAKADWQGDHLHITLESDRHLDREATVLSIRRGFIRLGLAYPTAAVHLYSCRVGQTYPDWSDQFMLSPTATASFTAADGSTPEPLDDMTLLEAGEQHSASDPTYLSDQALVVLAHLAPLFGYLVGASNFFIGVALLWGAPFLLPWRIIAPLALLLTKGSDSRFIKAQAKEALNFQISMVIYWVITLILCFILIGFVIAIPLALLEIISIIVATVRASEGKAYPYPFTIRFIR